jgi:hypothetical protein
MFDIVGSFLTYIHEYGLATGIVVFTGWFLVVRFWPWYTGIYLPMLATRQESRDHVMSDLRNAILELRILTGQLVNAIQQHDINTRDLIIALGSNQQAILDLLQDQKSPTS